MHSEMAEGALPDVTAMGKSRWFRWVIGAALAIFSVFQIYTSIFGLMEPLQQRPLFLGAGLLFTFLLIRARPEPDGKSGFAPVDIVLAALGAVACIHVVANYQSYADIFYELTTLDMALGCVAALLVLEAARRTIGWALPVLAIIGLAYMLYGSSVLSDPWAPPRMSLVTAVETLYTSTSGVFGYMLDIGTRVIAVYVIFGALLLSTGATEVFLKAANFVAGRSYGGPAKVCNISSALFGTITGSAVANVMAVGSVTIPTMKRLGYRPAYAAAIEAVSSAGGQLTPPIMGAGAFIMAEILAVPYSQVALAATIPALLYYTSIWISIDLYARREQLMPIPRDQLPSIRSFCAPREAGPTFLPLTILAVLLYMDFTPTFAGAVAILSLVGTLFVFRVIPALFTDGLDGFRRDGNVLVTQVVNGLVDGGKACAGIAILLACSSMIVVVLTGTGVGVKVSNLVFSLSGESIFIALILTALLSILLGMDVPTTASYILASAIAAPTIMRLGIEPLTAHLFVFYYAILSAITPPVCASVFAAAAIAKEKFWKVAATAMVLSVPIYLIPFIFVFREGILWSGSATTIIYDVAICLMAIFAINAAFVGHIRRPLSRVTRVFFALASAGLFYASGFADVIGTGLFVLALGSVFIFRGAQKPTSE